ncbi:penicillin-binding protein 2A [Gracilibacillus ureilyticus]|uniref:Penicillin-binding protein 2A n=1 Tax=Gracilibacillus ureilyticus TaxID=531814 RepID=A0A1H9SMZ6_9BACI|nr:transglycosylase domain-containing protein [Gracilibacillus ureilyticus]SER85743.1 penicillin-binding protein 2A [Gracilibacillus ureilyticus]
MEQYKQWLNKGIQWIKRFKWIVIIICSMFFLAIAGYLFIIFGGRFVFDEKSVILPTASTVVAEDGTVLGKLYTENRDYVTIEQIPDHVEDAFLALEDQRFYDHAGISFPSVARAVYRDILAMAKVEGGSTITQQLAKNLFLVNDKTWMRKTKEIMASVYLERNYSKKDILELYLNEVYFAHGIYGVGTAATYFFDKNIEDLTVEEGALLAAMVKAPNTYSPYIDTEKAKQRRDLALQQMVEFGSISTEEMLSLQAKTINVQSQEERSDPWLDDYFAHVLEEIETVYGLSRDALKRGGYTVEVYMDPMMQKLAYESMQQDQYFPSASGEAEGSFVLMEQDTGYLRALIAGRQFELNNVNHLHVPKQPGSLMKPIAVYGPAMELQAFQPYDFLSDQDIDYNGYRVNNADGVFSGETTMYEAIVKSKNAPAVWTLNEVGIPYSKSMLEKMNIILEDNGLAIALGGLEYGLTPIQVTEAYRTFIHNGEWVESRSIQSITDRHGEKVPSVKSKTNQVFRPQVAWDMLRMLEATVDNGTAQAGEYPGALAGKTGSTEHPLVAGGIKDAWFAGFTPEYVTAAWIGFSEVSEQNYLSTGSEAPTKLTKAILSEIDKQKQLEENFQIPEDITDLENPIELPTITDVSGTFKLGGFSIFRGKLSWTAAEDKRVIYRIYRQLEGEDLLIGEVEGKGQFTIDQTNVFNSGKYYVVPYNRLTDKEGERSNITSLSFDF